MDELAFLSATTALSYYVDALWYGSLGFADVFWKTLNLQATIFTTFFLATFAILWGSFLALKPATGCLDQLFVLPEARGRGIGRLLLDFAKARLPGGLWLSTAEDNHRARRFYERNGFRRSEEQTHPSLGHRTIIYRWP